MPLLRRLASAIAAVLIVGSACLAGAIAALLGFGDRFGPWVKRRGGRAVLGVSAVRPTIEGLDQVPAEGGFVLISNHESHFDGPLLAGWFPRDFTIVAKTELFRIPIMGMGFRAFGFIEVDRANRGQSVAQMDAATTYLHQGGAVLVFPEGHRTESGELQEFKKGGFVMALKAGVPLIPVGIAGTRAVLRSGSVAIRPGPVHMIIGPPIPVAGWSLDDRDALVAAGRVAVAELRDRAQRALPQNTRAR